MSERKSFRNSGIPICEAGVYKKPAGGDIPEVKEEGRQIGSLIYSQRFIPGFKQALSGSKVVAAIALFHL